MNGSIRSRIRFVVRRDWNFAKTGKPAAIFQKLLQKQGPRKEIFTDLRQRELTFDPYQTLVFLSDSPRLTTKFKLLNFYYICPLPAATGESFASQRDHRVDCRSSPGR